MFDPGPKRLRGIAVRHGHSKRLTGLARRLSGPRTVGRRWPSRRWLFAGLGLLALIGLIGLLSLLEADSPHPQVGGIHTPRVHPSFPHSPDLHPRVPDLPTPHPRVPDFTAPTLGAGGNSAGGEDAPEQNRVYRVDERDIDNHQVTVEERKASHPHHAKFDLSLIALAALSVLAAPAIKRRKPFSGKLKRLVTSLALAVALTLAVASVHTWESPKPPQLVSLHTAEYHPEMQPQGVDRHREGDTIYVVHHFSREEPVRRLEHIHAWSIETWSQLPFLVLSALLTAFLVRERWVRRRRSIPLAGPTSPKSL
jgi:hypothetical protein